MPYKHKAVDINQAVSWMTTPHINLKLIPNVRGDAEIAQLVSTRHLLRMSKSLLIQRSLGRIGTLQDPSAQRVGRYATKLQCR